MNNSNNIQYVSVKLVYLQMNFNVNSAAAVTHVVLTRLLQSKAVLMYIASQIINQFHGRIEKNKCSNIL